jgi:four helix bundle protein
MRDYKKYTVWQEAHQLVLFVYKSVLKELPATEKYELASQLKRAVYSIPMNIAEGTGRNTDKDFLHFLDIALGSVHEVEYCFFLILELNYIKETTYEEGQMKIDSVKGKLIKLIKTIRK